jgi:MoaA/NifB/PqqE/SkfB family radical SAM enzyme
VDVTSRCAACETQPRIQCGDAFGRLGVKTLHWECWSNCNLTCGFCYRSRESPLGTADALRLIGAVAHSGVTRLVFAGGDPALRRDLLRLTSDAAERGLRVEIQTNAEHTPAHILEALKSATTVGLSLDSALPDVHDLMRGKAGNHANVIALLDHLSQDGVDVILRTVVTFENHASIPEIAAIVNRYDCIRRWSLMEFTPVGEGKQNSVRFRVDSGKLEEAAVASRRLLTNPTRLDLYTNEAKVGTYAIVTPDGRLQGTTKVPPDGLDAYERVGSFLDSHLCELADLLPFDIRRHAHRYGDGR